MSEQIEQLNKLRQKVNFSIVAQLYISQLIILIEKNQVDKEKHAKQLQVEDLKSAQEQVVLLINLIFLFVVFWEIIILGHGSWQQEGGT